METLINEIESKNLSIDRKLSKADELTTKLKVYDYISNQLLNIAEKWCADNQSPVYWAVMNNTMETCSHCNAGQSNCGSEFYIVAQGVDAPTVDYDFCNDCQSIYSVEDTCSSCDSCESCDACQGCNLCNGYGTGQSSRPNTCYSCYISCQGCDECESCDTCQGYVGCDSCQSGFVTCGANYDDTVCYECYGTSFGSTCQGCYTACDSSYVGYCTSFYGSSSGDISCVSGFCYQNQ